MGKSDTWLKWIAVALLALAPATLPAQQTTTPASPVVVLLDGQEVAAESIELHDGELSGKGLENALSLDKIRQIRVRPPAVRQTAPTGIRVGLAGEGQLTVSQVTIADDNCTVASQAAGKLELPIDVVRSIAFDSAKLPADYHKALETPSADVDRLFLKAGDSVEGISALIESLDEKVVKFDVDGKSIAQPRDKLLGIVMAQAIAAGDLPPCSIRLTDGGTIGGELVSIGHSNVVLKLGGSEITLPWRAVQSLDVRSSKMKFLSDLKPTSAQQQSIVTLTRLWQRDRSYSGKPLRLGPRTFEKGIGAHSRSELTFSLDREYASFAAVVGIDAATEGKGDCVMSVLGDGTQLWTSRVKGVDPPREINVDVSGVNELTLLVEPGEELDLADHANWADARVIRTAK